MSDQMRDAFLFNCIAAIWGGLVVVLGVFSHQLRRFIGVPPVLVVAGAVAAFLWPPAARFFDMDPGGEIFFELTRLILAINLIEVALRFEAGRVRQFAASSAVLLFWGMLGMWCVSALLSHWAFHTGWLNAALLGAIITPTDPVIASIIVSGKLSERNIPERIRIMLSLESGANDGLAYLFVILALLLASGGGWGQWFWQTGCGEILAASLAAFAFGAAFGALFRFLCRKNFISEDVYWPLPTALAVFVLGAAKLMHSDAIFAVFSAGLGFTFGVGEEHRGKLSLAQKGHSFYTYPFFFFFGLVLPWKEWITEGWPLVFWAAAVLLLRRLPIVLLAGRSIKDIAHPADLGFIGWFGPIGVSALFYASLALREKGWPIIWTAVSFMVFVSIVVHGLSASFLIRLYPKIMPPKETEQSHKGRRGLP